MGNYEFKEEDCYCHKCGAEKDSLELDFNFVKGGIETYIACNECEHERLVDFITSEQAEKEMIADLQG